MEIRGRHELKHNINYIDCVEPRSKLPYIMNYDTNAKRKRVIVLKAYILITIVIKP